MKSWIENVSRDDIRHGRHYDCGENSMLIQISDPPGDHPTPKCNFREVHQFDFLDAEDSDDFPEEAKISDEQAAEIARLLQRDSGQLHERSCPLSRWDLPQWRCS